MSARFEITEVSLTATIGEVFGQFFNSVVARDAPLSYQISKPITRDRGQLGSLAEGQNSLGIE